MQNQQLASISALTNFPHIQELYAQENELQNLYATPDLTRLDVSHNQVLDCLYFMNPVYPSNLLVANYAFNAIRKLHPEYTRNYKYLQVLNLEGNQLSSLSGIEELVQLHELNVNNNQLVRLNGLESLNALQVVHAV